NPAGSAHAHVGWRIDVGGGSARGEPRFPVRPAEEAASGSDDTEGVSSGQTWTDRGELDVNTRDEHEVHVRSEVSFRELVRRHREYATGTLAVTIGAPSGEER